jgi:branched-chain amino acid transport system permease protein
MPVGQLLVAGVSIGGLYALIGIAYSIVYRSTRTINFAQGDLGMLAAYIALSIGVRAGLGLLPGYIGAVIAVALIMGVLEVVAFRPLYRYDGGPIFVIVSSIGLVFVLQTVMTLIWQAQAISVPEAISGTVTVAGVVIEKQRLLICGVVVILLIVLQWFLRSRVGVGMRAAAENPDDAALLGVVRRRMATLSYVIGGGLSGVAGVLAGPIILLTPTGGATIGLVGLIAAIFGGLGNLWGALLGGIVMGLVNSFGSYVVGGTYVELITFGILMATFLLRPQGLLGEEGASVRA